MWKDYIKTYDPDNITATLPKSKRNLDKVEIPDPLPLQPQQPQDTFAPIAYPGSGHLVNITENYFQNQYQTATLTAGTTTNFYPSPNSGQSMGILLQPSTQRSSQPPTAYIVLQPKSEPQQNTTINISNVGFSRGTEIIPDTEKKKVNKERRRGPLVKQWRYNNIFHDEINGAALTAIKTRLGMYYAESDVARKKPKQTRPTGTIPTGPIPTGAIQTITADQVPQVAHTVTIYTHRTN